MVASLPAIAKIKELRLAIICPSDDVTRPINRKAPFGPAYCELWRGEVLFANLTKENTQELVAFFESLDGRVTPFALPLVAPHFSQPASYTAALQAVPVLGADTVHLNLSPASGTLLAGTLFTVGDIDDEDYQLFEVLEDVAASANTAVKVAPRVGRAFTSVSPVDVGSVSGKFCLSDDKISAPYTVGYGTVTASVMERP